VSVVCVCMCVCVCVCKRVRACVSVCVRARAQKKIKIVADSCSQNSVPTCMLPCYRTNKECLLWLQRVPALASKWALFVFKPKYALFVVLCNKHVGTDYVFLCAYEHATEI
jgi:hypothetical protein